MTDDLKRVGQAKACSIIFLQLNLQDVFGGGSGVLAIARILRRAFCERAPIGLRLECEPTCLSANGFQDFLTNPTLTQNNRKYQTIENAENPVKSRAFGVLPFPKPETVDEVAELTGYHRRTILRYVQRKYIYAVNIMGKYYISKQSIINYLATDKAFKNAQKSEWHDRVILMFCCDLTMYNN